MSVIRFFLLMGLAATACQSSPYATNVRRSVPLTQIAWREGVGAAWLSSFRAALPMVDDTSGYVFDPLGVVRMGCLSDHLPSADRCVSLTLSSLLAEALQHTDASPIDRIERILYHRYPGQSSEFLPDPRLMAAFEQGDTLWINLFMPCEISNIGPRSAWSVTMETEYPLEGITTLQLEGDRAETWTLAFRQPGWTDNRPDPDSAIRYRWRSNQKLVADLAGTFLYPELRNGYAYLSRTWQPGDRIQLRFPMSLRRLIYLKSDGRHSLSLERGPVVLATKNDPESQLSFPDRGYLQENVSEDGRKTWHWADSSQDLTFRLWPQWESRDSLRYQEVYLQEE